MAAIAYNTSNFGVVFPSLFNNRENPSYYHPSTYCGLIEAIDYSKLSALEVKSFPQFSKAFKILLKTTKQISAKHSNPTAILKQHYAIAKAALDINEHVRNSFSESKNKLLIPLFSVKIFILLTICSLKI